MAFRFDDAGKVRPALTNVRRIVGISTYGAPWTYVKLLQDGGRRMLTRALRLNCGARTPTTWLGLYSIDTLGDAERAAFLDRVGHTMAHLHGHPARKEGTPLMRTLVVHCHPDPESFTAAIRDRAVEALRHRGDEVRITDLYADGFDPVLSAEERARHLEPGPDPAMAGHAADLQWCEQVVLVYPTWWSGQPAMLKGWIDRVWVNEVAFELPPQSNRVHAGLRNVRRIVAITTHGSSKLVNALEGEAGKRTVTRTLRAVCHPLTRTSWIAMYGVDTSTDAARRAFLARVERRLR